MNVFDVELVLFWWKSLDKDSGGRARLRRARGLTEIAFIEAYHRLYEQVNNVDGGIDKEKIAIIAGLCTHVKENRRGKIAEQMAEGGDKPRVSKLRFRRILAISDREKLFHAMIRIIQMLGGSVDICDLSKVVYFWNENTKKQLAFDYYSKVK